MFSLICAWTNSWVNNRDAGDLRRYRTHHDVTNVPFWDFPECPGTMLSGHLSNIRKVTFCPYISMLLNVVWYKNNVQGSYFIEICWKFGIGWFSIKSFRIISFVVAQSYDCPNATLRTRFMGPTWGPSGTDRTQVGPMLAPWTLLSGQWTTSPLKLH